MKSGDKIEYVATGQFHGMVIEIQGGKAEVTVDSAGWLAKANHIVPLSQIKTPNSQVGSYVHYVVEYMVTATVVTAYDSALEVIPDYCAQMRSLISLDQVAHTS